MEYKKIHLKYKNSVVKSMKELNTYSNDYKYLIDIYSGMLAQYEILINRLIKDNLNIEVETATGGTRKSATATATEKLREQIILYSDRLLLNPKALDKITTGNNKESSLSIILNQLDKGR